NSKTSRIRKAVLRCLTCSFSRPNKNETKANVMKTKTLLLFIAAGVLCGFASPDVRAQDIDNFAPVVVKTVPEARTKNVPTGEFEVKITFSKEMADQSWSWASAWQNSDPESVGKPHYEADHKTCVLKVKLE